MAICNWWCEMSEQNPNESVRREIDQLITRFDQLCAQVEETQGQMDAVIEKIDQRPPSEKSSAEIDVQALFRQLGNRPSM